MESFERALEKATAKGSPDITAHCVVVAVVDKTGKIIYQKAAGHTSVAEDAPPVALDNTFAVASCTKLLTSIAAMQCVERGLVTLDEPLDKHLPDLGKQQVYTLNDGPDKEQNPFIITAPKTKVTLRHLLTHTSGVAYDAWHPVIIPYRAAQGQSSHAMTGDLKKFLDMPLTFEPGTEWMYGGSLDWAGQLVERLNGGTTLGQYMEENIFKPLGITQMTFHLEQKPETREKLVGFAARTPEGGLVAASSPLADPAKDDIGGAGLYTSVQDYIKVLADIVSESSKLLKPETLEQMFTPQLDPKGKPVEKLHEMEVFYHNSTGGSAKDASINYGLGSLLYTDDIAATGAPKGTLAWGGLPNILWWANREHGIAAMYCVEILPPDDIKNTELSTEFQKCFWKLRK